MWGGVVKKDEETVSQKLVSFSPTHMITEGHKWDYVLSLISQRSFHFAMLERFFLITANLGVSKQYKTVFRRLNYCF